MPAIPPRRWSRLRCAALVCAVAVLVSVALPSVASTRQMAAGDDPDVTEQLIQELKRCRRDPVKKARALIAVLRQCTYFYSFDPLSETDATHDYGVLWLQVTVAPERGWCTRRVEAAIQPPDNVAVYEQAPPEAASTRRPTPVEVELVASAGGNALETGSVAQRFTLFPKSMVPVGEGQVGVSWRGQTAEKLAFATGTEIGWSLFDPPNSFSSGLRSIRFVSC